MELATCRSTGWGAGPIPWLAVRAYADEHGLVGEMRSDLFHHMHEMDRAYLHWVAEHPPKSPPPTVNEKATPKPRYVKGGGRGRRAGDG